MQVDSLFGLNNSRPERIFLSYIREYQPVDKDVLFSEKAKGSFSDFHRRKSSVYMIAKTKKIAFIPESFQVGGDFCLHGRVRVGQRIEDVTFNIAKLLFEQSGVKEKYDNWRTWAAKAMSLWVLERAPDATAGEKYRRSSSVDVDLSDEAQLYINCKLYQGIGGGNLNRRVIVRALDLAHMFDWNLLEDIEILYVGKSTDSALRRTMNHNKWGEITSYLKSDEFAFVYFMDVEQSSIFKSVVGPVALIANTVDEELDRNSIALITEAALIKHFFDEEKYNRQIVGQKFTKVKIVREKLIKRGYTALSVELILEGVFGVLGTKKSGKTSTHIFRCALENL